MASCSFLVLTTLMWGGQVFCGLPLSLNLFDVFLRIRLGFSIWKKAADMRCPSRCFILGGFVVSTQTVMGNVKLHHVIMIALGPFPPLWSYYFSYFLLYSLEAGHRSWFILGREEFSFMPGEGLLCVCYWNSSVRETCLFYPIYLFVFVDSCSFITVDLCLFILYLGYDLMLG